jgi:hypothetical protein
MPGQTIPPLLQLWRAIALVNTPAFVVGSLAGITGHRWGAFLLIANLAVQIGGHLVIGAWSYRDVMSRPWPTVAPIDDWDD